MGYQMPRILEKKSITLHWGGSLGNSTSRGTASFGTITPDYDVLPAQVESAIEELNDDDWDIKSITPLTETAYSSTILQNNADPLGMGMLKANAGSETITGTYTAGVIIVAQRWREITEAEAAERQREKAARRSAEDAILAAEAEEARRNAGPIAYDRIMSLPIERRGGIMSNTWLFNGQEYHTKGMAEDARRNMAHSAKIQAERDRDGVA
ncbi:hypothetical protein [Microvirga yunnanensis]|uniref:hypothetical protein n=1 Tax=Microvirga yunnanensis TaxID=2953740 RepID=UPI0021C8B367|nr:hypothetical protein [Microvirga sp. HBU65207]